MSKLIKCVYNSKSSTTKFEIGQVEKGIKTFRISSNNASLIVELVNTAGNTFNIVPAVNVQNSLTVTFPDFNYGESPMSFILVLPSKCKASVMVLEEGTKGIPMRAFMDKYAEYISLEDSPASESDEPTPIPETDNPTTIPESEV